MTLPAVIFTYAGDAPALPWCVRGVQAAGLIPVVAEDAAAPLPPITRGWLARGGVRVVSTRFPRRGNLNGTDCAAGICRTLAAAAAWAGAGHVIKLDTDTIIVRPAAWLASPEADMIALVDRGGRTGAFGCCYRLSRRAAIIAAAALAVGPFDPAAPEDQTIHRTVSELVRVRELEFDAAAGPFSAFPQDGDAADFRRRFDVLSVGNPPPAGWHDRPQEMVRQLRRLIAAAGIHQAD